MSAMGDSDRGAYGVVLKGVSKTIKGKRVLDDVSVQFPAGKVSGIRGPNGSGKTMLLRAVAGLLAIDNGSVDVLGERVGGTGAFPPSMGFLIEPMGFWDEFTGRENLEMLASIRGKVGPQEVARTLARVGLDPRDTRRVGAYSLGMRQRLGIAQALMESPRLLLLDEPTNALDEDGKDLVARIIAEERSRGITVIVVSHDLPELDRISDVQYRMSEGRIEGVRER